MNSSAGCYGCGLKWGFGYRTALVTVPPVASIIPADTVKIVRLWQIFGSAALDKNPFYSPTSHLRTGSLRLHYRPRASQKRRDIPSISESMLAVLTSLAENTSVSRIFSENSSKISAGSGIFLAKRSEWFCLACGSFPMFV